MTYEEGLSELKRRYDAGERRILVSDDVFEAVHDGLLANRRLVSAPNPIIDHFNYKSAKVFRESDLPDMPYREPKA